MTWQKFEHLLSSLQFDDTPAGGALVIYHQGQKVVDTAFGQAIPDMPWSTHTLSVNFSIGKGVMATLIAILVSKGILAYDAPISRVWRDFAQNGKYAITLRQVLTHQAGLFNIASVTHELSDLLDWHIMSEKIAAMTVDIPKSQEVHHYASAYSALVSGWILGNVVEKATHMSLQQALDEYLAKPLGVVGELYWGLPKDKLGQIAKPVRYFNGEPQPSRKKPILKPDSPETLAFLNALDVAPLWQEKLGDKPLTTANINQLYFDTKRLNLVNYKNALMPNGRDGISYHRDDVLQAVIPAANGISTANALARMYAMHAGGGVYQGLQMIDKHTLHDMARIQVYGFDAVMPANMRWRLGFHRLFSMQDVPNAYGHMGYNGSVAFADQERQLSFAFIHNFDTTMLNDIRQFVLSETAIACA